MQQAPNIKHSAALWPADNIGGRAVSADRTPVSLALAAWLLIPIALAVGLAASNEIRVLSLVLAAVGALVILASPYYGLVFFMALLYTRPEDTIPALAGAHFTLLVSLMTLAGWLIGACLKRCSIVRSPLVDMMVVFGAFAIVSAVPGGNLGGAVMDISRLVVFVVLAINLIRNRCQYRLFVSGVILFTSYLAAYSIDLYQSGAALMVHGLERSRAKGIFADPNDLATTIAGGLAFILFRIQDSRGARRLVYVVLTGVCVWAIALTDSRSGLLSLLVVGVGWILLSCRDKRRALIIAAVLAAALVVLAPSRMRNFDSGEESANSRFWFWSEGLDQLVEHPILGVGYGGFPSVNNGITAHNSFVLCFAELGLPAYFCWIACLYYCYTDRRLNGPRKQPENDEDRVNVTSARLGLTAYLTGAFWLSHTYSPILYLFMSLPAAAQLISRGGSGRRLTSTERMRESAIIAAIAISSIVFIRLIAIHFRGR